jgi:hypothetical protein
MAIVAIPSTLRSPPACGTMAAGGTTMLTRWMRMGRALRPWIVAVALACSLAAVGCKRGGRAEPSGGASARDGSCEPRDYYGPASACDDDEDCVRQRGAGWYCVEETTTVDDGCGNQVPWTAGHCARRPDAEADAGRPVSDAVAAALAAIGEQPTFYGPLPASAMQPPITADGLAQTANAGDGAAPDAPPGPGQARNGEAMPR